MVDIVSLDAVNGIVGDVAGALAVMIESVGTTIDSPEVDSRAGCPLDIDMASKRKWITATFTAKMSEVPEQSATTVEAADLGTTILGNADVDGYRAVRSAEV